MYKIRALLNSHFDASSRTMFLDGNPQDRIPAAGYFWIIEGQGRLMAVDTGIGVSNGQRQEIQRYLVEVGQDTVSLLNRTGQGYMA